MSTRPPPRSTRACPATSGPAPCGGHSIRRWMRHCAGTGGRHDGETAGQLPVAAAQRDGRARHVHHHRAGAAARRPGITLSASQVHRLVTGTPERLSLPVLAALCDILEVTPAELIVTRAQNAAPRRAVAGGGPAPAGAGGVRPRPARLRPEP